MKPVVTIEYCPRCGWMLRAAYLGQEVLTTFTDEIHGVMLQPSEVNGTFRIRVDGTEVFDRRKQDGFPEVKTLKQWIRDIVNPQKNLGHSDKK